MNEKVMLKFKHNDVFSTPITTEEIVTTVKSLPNGKAPGIDGISYEHIKYRDDLTMLSRKKSGLDKMLQTSCEYSNKSQFTFNIEKTVVLTYGEKQEEHGTNCVIRKWKLGSLGISGKDTWSNLGKIWDINKHSSAAVLSAVGRGREINTSNEISEWYLLANEYPKNLLEITNVIRLLFESYKITGKRGKLQNVEQSLMKTSEPFEKIKKNLHTPETKANNNEPPGAAVEATINLDSATDVSENSQVIESDEDVVQNSEVNRVDSSINRVDIEFVGMQRKAVKRIFLGGIKVGVTTQKIVRYMKDRGIEPTFVRLMKSKRKRTTSAKTSTPSKSPSFGLKGFVQDRGYRKLNGKIIWEKNIQLKNES
ncbi:Hypothetical predicted protein [Paramuricea clavata]|uniref:Uncharacterized protein n=1 Tax=Paramuricea clavata TaxID=317549 RepID=A0A6S7K3H3_PARCT|nr:Hypothetical predicted protein [Paramuricea clavata]